MEDSDDSDDLLNYTPLQRSQATPRYTKPDLKPSKLSLSYRSSQTTSNKPKVETIQLKVESDSSEMNVTTSKTQRTRTKNNTPSKSRKTKIKKGTPVKSRADHPEENYTAFQLNQWKFLYGSQSCKIEKTTPQKRKGNSEEGSSMDSFASGSQYKKRNNSGESIPHCTSKRQDEQRCWHCRFPFKSNQKNSHHSILCSSKDLSDLPRCYKGNQCEETREHHFLEFNHREEFLDTKVPFSLVKSNTLMKTNPVTSNSRHGDVAGPSTCLVSSIVTASNDELSVINLVSDDEESTLSGSKGRSLPLFDLDENEHYKAPSDKEPLTSENQNHRTSLDKKSVTSENTHVSSNLFEPSSLPWFNLEETEDHKVPSDKEPVTSENQDHKTPLNKETVTSENTQVLSDLVEPDINLNMDDQETVYFDNQSPQAASSTKEDMQGDSSGSENFDLKDSEVTTNGLDLEDSASLAEEAIDHVAIPLLEKICKWRKGCEEAKTSLPAIKNNQSTGLKKSKNIVIQPRCIHFHFHEANPGPSQSKENGQTSILNYFSPTKPKEQCSPCSEKATVSKQENIAAWQRLMGHKQKRSIVPLPSISQSSSSQDSSSLLSKVQEKNNNTRQRWGTRGSAEPKNCPFYKYIPDTTFVVDAFNYGSVDGVTAYFLSHFHYDHYCGLHRAFSHPIYCSEITARLVNKRLGVPLKYLNPIPMWKPQDVFGVEVTLLKANHCPGAVMFLFKLKSGVRHLHVGDFRAHPSMEKYPALQYPIHSLFLDTTYCSPEHDFPTQEKMIEKCVSLAQNHYLSNAKTLFVVGSYTIGKERVFKAVASSLNSSIWVKNYKKQVLNCINDKEILPRLTENQTSAMVHVLPMSEVKGPKLKDYLNQLRSTFTEIVGICPTGWEFTSSSNVNDISSEHPYPDVYIYGIPYSEHSNFSELRRFVQFIKPKKIIPTVNNGSQARRKAMEKYFREWQTQRHLFS